MTFEEFQATGRRCDDLEGNGRGRRYLHALYIDEVLPNWPEQARARGKWHLLIERSEWITDDLEALERRLYDFAADAGYFERPDNPLVHYHGDNEAPAVMRLDRLIANFDSCDGWKYHHNETDMRAELASRGWYDGLHENGHYLVINLDLLGLEMSKVTRPK